jgi:hypothetical protein
MHRRRYEGKAVTVYVDDVRHKFGTMIMCHLWVDTEEELFAIRSGTAVELCNRGRRDANRKRGRPRVDDLALG